MKTAYGLLAIADTLKFKTGWGRANMALKKSQYIAH